MTRSLTRTSTSLKKSANAWDYSTRVLHPYGESERKGPLVAPVVQSTTFHRSSVDEQGGHAYSRVSNPTVDELEQALGNLEDALPAVTFSTGLAAETALFITLLKSGDHAVLAQTIYGGTDRLFRRIFDKFGISATFVDATDLEAAKAAIRPETKLLFIETPANPTLALTDIAEASRIAKEAGIPLIVDNTFLTPVLQRPLDIGADICVYSTTKHIEGHSVALGGAIVARNPELLDELRFVRKSTGTIQTPYNAWLTLRGLATLPLRIEHHSRQAAEIARWLENHALVSKVFYPGLESSEDYELAQEQHEGLHGGVLSFELIGGAAAAYRFLSSAKLCSLVEHVGAVHSLLTHPASMTHVDVPPAQRELIGISDGLIRLSVGLESIEDIIADLDSALTHAHSVLKNSKEEICLHV